MQIHDLLFKDDGLISRPDTLEHEFEKFSNMYETLRIMNLDLHPREVKTIVKQIRPWIGRA